jgi:hypothetical protein
MQPQMTPVGGKICRGGQLLPVMVRFRRAKREKETAILLGFLSRLLLGMPLAEEHA